MNNIASSENSKVMGVLSFVFGIIAIVISWLPVGRFIVIVLGIAAIVLGGMEIGRVNKNLSEKRIKNMAITGIVLGGLAIVFNIIMPIAWGLIAGQWFRSGHMGHMGLWKLPELGRLKNLK